MSGSNGQTPKPTRFYCPRCRMVLAPQQVRGNVELEGRGPVEYVHELLVQARPLGPVQTVEHRVVPYR